MEYLDIVDENGVPTGKIAERTAAHKQGLRHRTSHVWILRERAGKVEVLLQKRSQNKDSFPGCYDISSAGHIPAGVDFIPSALRELKEELGCSVSENELIYCGQRRFSYDGVFMERNFMTGRSATFMRYGWIEGRRILSCRKKNWRKCAGLNLKAV
ncbi:MAG: NUDIX hydrolase [Gallintestinimicrobium sp.]